MTRSNFVAYFFALLTVSFANHASASCVIDEYEITRLTLTPNGNVNRCEKELTTPQLINSLRVVDRYWAQRTTNPQRYALLSKRYKDTIGRVYNMKKPEQYLIPLSEAERVWQGYKINQVTVVAGNSMEISLQVKWEQEGYLGTMTYIMTLVSEDSQWAIANVHF